MCAIILESPTDAFLVTLTIALMNLGRNGLPSSVMLVSLAVVICLLSKLCCSLAKHKPYRLKVMFRGSPLSFAFHFFSIPLGLPIY